MSYRPLYRAVYYIHAIEPGSSKGLIAHYIGLSTYAASGTVGVIASLIAHYIGLSTELVLKEKQENKHLSPTISGCLRLGWRVNDNG